MAATVVVPDRSLNQRMQALERANVVRIYRARLKEDIRAGRVKVAGLIAAPPEHLASMKLFELLLSVPKMGRVKANKALRQTMISPSKTVGGLSDRQRDQLVDYLRKY